MFLEDNTGALLRSETGSGKSKLSWSTKMATDVGCLLRHLELGSLTHTFSNLHSSENKSGKKQWAQMGYIQFDKFEDQVKIKIRKNKGQKLPKAYAHFFFLIFRHYSSFRFDRTVCCVLRSQRSTVQFLNLPSQKSCTIKRNPTITKMKKHNCDNQEPRRNSSDWSPDLLHSVSCQLVVTCRGVVSPHIFIGKYWTHLIFKNGQPQPVSNPVIWDIWSLNGP